MKSARVLVGIAAAWLAVASAAAQMPDKFTNLKVLPKEIGKRELTDVMRGFSSALGVRCDHCHMESEKGDDFATDDLEPKKIARSMMKMTQDLNAKLPTVTGRPSPLEVRCVTCHRGLAKPEGLDQVLAGVAEKEGVGAVAAKYKELREKYYGSGSYDFGPQTLNDLARRQAEQKKDLDGAIALAKLNIEYNPKAAASHVILGQFYVAKGDKDAALASVKRALEIDPANRFAKQALERLQAPPK